MGVDVGGTFTDIAVLDAAGLRIAKVPTTPADPSEGFLAAVDRLSVGVHAAFVHGTTTATNALLERRGARTAFLASEGFRDLLEIGRQTRNELYSLQPTRPRPLVDREMAFEVPERVGSAGEVLTPLREADLEDVLIRIRDAGAESLAVCFLFSFLRPEHELLAGRLAERLGLPVSLSHQVVPEYREYERASTTVANAYVAPVMGRYLGRLQDRLDERRAAGLHVMQSNGGAISAAVARREPVRTVLSGPAAGVVAARETGALAGFSRLLAFDMGGTSTDVCLIDGEARLSPEGGVIDGLPIRTPMLAIHTVGAGGGSLAQMSPGGFRVGPQSAGAEPGPACYGVGSQPTVTDANLLLGRLGPEPLLAGAMPLDRERAAAALERLARGMGLSVERAALGTVQVVNAGMARALRRVSVEQGYDARQYVLLAYGGSGPLHACELAELLGMETVLVPRYPGAFSALGLLLSDLRKEFARTVMLTLARATPPLESRNPVLAALLAAFESLHGEALKELEPEGLETAAWQISGHVDMRYQGQSYELTLPCPAAPTAEGLFEEFDRAHRLRYGTSLPEAPCEIVNIRLRAWGKLPRPEPERAARQEIGAPHADRVTRVVGEAGPEAMTLYRREALRWGHTLDGPALAIQEDATTWIPAGWRARVDEWYNMVVSRVFSP